MPPPWLFQSAPPAAQAAPVPPAGIALDFIATGPDEKPVTDLTAADIILNVGGKNRALRSLELVTPAERGRASLLLVDEATLFGLEPVVKEAIAKLVASLKPWDRIAYVSTRGGRTATPTTKHALTTTAAEAMVTGPGVLHTCLSDLLRGIQTVTRNLPRGRSSTLVVLSRGSGFDPTFGTSDAAGCTPRSEALRPVAEAISASQINVHLLTVDHVDRSWGLDTLAGNTGSRTGLLTWAGTSVLERAVAAPTSYYRAILEPDETAATRPQRVDLRVNRPNVKARTSPTVLIRPPAVAKAGTF